MLELVGDDEGSYHEDEGEQRRVGLWRHHLLDRLAIGVGGVEYRAVDDDAAHAVWGRRRDSLVTLGMALHEG